MSFSMVGRKNPGLDEISLMYTAVTVSPSTMISKTGHLIMELHHQLVSDRFQCGVMSINNLANPYWWMMSCTVPFLTAILCVSKVTSGQIHVVEESHDSSVLDKNCVVYSGKCYLFLLDNVHKWHFKSSCLTNISRFEFLFDAIESQFPPLWQCDGKKLIAYEKVIDKFIYSKFYFSEKEKVDGLVIQKSRILPSNPNTKNLAFRCNDGAFISYFQVCDGVLDCSINRSEEEENCTCSVDEVHAGCKFVISSNKSQCSLFYRTLKDGMCNMYLSPLAFQHSLGENENSENLLLSCRKNGKPGYPVSDICKYELDQRGQLTPCQDGEHMQNCRNFECLTLFKCPGYFCIPWRYLCDGKIDCPGGHDENVKTLCGVSRTCMHLFKCKGTSICVHQSDICDGTTDCLAGDDELICALKGSPCSAECDCLTFVLRCIDISFPDFKTEGWHILQHYVILLERNTFVNKRLVSTIFSNAVLLSIINCSLQVLDLNYGRLQHLLLLDVNTNEISFISPISFKFTFDIKIINISRNEVREINQETFSNLTLLCLDLSENQVSTISFSINSSVHFLRLEMNSLSGMSDVVLLDVIILRTNEPRVCCLFPNVKTCILEISMWQPCYQLLSKTLLASIFCTILTGCAVSIMSMVSQQQMIAKGLVKTHGFAEITHVISIQSLCFVVYVVVLVCTDLSQKYIVVLNNVQWMSSLTCFISFCFSLDYLISVPVLLCFMSYSRLMVVLKPFDASRRSRKKINMCLTGITLGSVSLTFGVALLAWLLQQSTNSELCFPLFSFTRKLTVTQLTAFLCASEMIICFGIFFGFSVALVLSLKSSQKCVEGSSSRKATNTSVYVQLIVTNLSNFVSWIGSLVLFFCSLFEAVSPAVSAWLIVIIPLNIIVFSASVLSVSLSKLVKHGKGNLS